MALARLAARLYRAPRRLTVGGTVTEAVEPNRGVLPGCGWAMTPIKVYYREPCVEIMRARPGVALNVAVDDIQITACGSGDFVVEALVEAAGDMLEVVSSDLHCVAKRATAATVASDRAVAKRLRSVLRSLAGVETRSIEVLGCDYIAGARKGQEGPCPSAGQARWQPGRRE